MANVNDTWIEGWLATKPNTDEFETEYLENEARVDEYDTLGMGEGESE